MITTSWRNVVQEYNLKKGEYAFSPSMMSGSIFRDESAFLRVVILLLKK